MKHMFTEGEPCLVCGVGELSQEKQDSVIEYKGHKIVVPDVVKFQCHHCGEGFYDPAREPELEKLFADARRRIDGLLTSEEIRALRKSVGMTQVEFARLFKVGEKNFARYETGQSTQERGMDWALRFLQLRPELFNVMHGRPLEPAARISYEISKASAGKVIPLKPKKIAPGHNTFRTSVEDSSSEIAV